MKWLFYFVFSSSMICSYTTFLNSEEMSTFVEEKLYEEDDLDLSFDSQEPFEDDFDLTMQEELDTFFEDELEEETMASPSSIVPPTQMTSLPTTEKKTPKEPIVAETKELTKESLPVTADAALAQTETFVSSTPSETEKDALAISRIDFREVFTGSPLIYSVLGFLSFVSITIFFYNFFTVRKKTFLPEHLIHHVRLKLVANQYDEALELCAKEKHFFCKMLAGAILARKHGLQTIVEIMQGEAKRSATSFWQRIHLLNDIALIAPMLGLLGTVLGFFYAFYDINRSIESVSILFDGLGISVGTTVLGLFVAILSTILHSMAKYRLIRVLAEVENETQTLAALIDTRNIDQVQDKQPLYS